MIKPPHPGETIREDYPVPLGMGVNRLAQALGVGAARMNGIVRGKRISNPFTICAWRSARLARGSRLK